MDKRTQAIGYIRQLLEDEYLQQQLRTAANASYATYMRARKQRAHAADDKDLYRNLREAATALRNTATALQAAEPAGKRRGRKLAVAAAAAGASAWLAMRLQKDGESAPHSSE